MKEFLEKVRDLHNCLISLKVDSWSSDLCGACAFSAYIVYMLAKKMNYAANLCLINDFKWGSHCWCIIEGKVVDATATQFPELEEQLDENGVLVTENKDIYAELFDEYKQHVRVVNDTTFLSLTSNWDDQSVPYCFEKYGAIIKKNFDIEFSYKTS